MKSTADFSYLHSSTTTEASEVQARLLEFSKGILNSDNAHSVLLQEQARVLEKVQSYLNALESGGSSPVPTRPSSIRSHPSDYHRDTSDNTSMMSERTFRLPRPDYIEDLKASRVYKRLRHFGREIDSSTESVLSFDSRSSTGHWSMLSDITLGDLSVSQIAVLNLPLDLADVSNPEPFKEPSSTETNICSKSRFLRKWSSRGRIHNAIENGNGFVVRALLTMGVDIEELDSHGRTPLVRAAMKGQGSICKLLLEKGASVEALKASTSCMDINERSKLLEPLITKAMDGSRTVTALKLLVLTALGTNYGDDNQSSRSMMNVAIEMSYGLAVCAIIHLEPQVLAEADTDGRAPFAYAYHLRRNEICEVLLQSSGLDIQTTTEVVKLEGDFAGRVRAAIREKCPHLLWFLLGTVEKIGTRGQTPLARAAEAVPGDISYGSWNYICEDKASRANTKTAKKMRPNSGARRCIATTMQELIQELVEKDFKPILVLLSLVEARDAEGWTPLASADRKSVV